MIYGKLPVVFLSTIASEKQGTLNSQIAAYILDHLESVKDMGIQQMAKVCSVSVSSISRFCKDIGLEDFAELRELLVTNDMCFEGTPAKDADRDVPLDYGRKVQTSIELTAKTVDINGVRDFCQDLLKYKNIAAFGLLKAGAAAICFQSDLLMLGKQIYTHISYTQQMQYIKSCGKNDLILIFSYTGDYFSYQDMRPFWKKSDCPKIWMVCGTDKAVPPFVTRVIRFKSPQNQASHPYQLQFVAGVISRQYASLLSEATEVTL